MNEVMHGNYVLFDMIEQTETMQQADFIARDCMTLADAAIRFARVERVPRYDKESRENDAEHSYMLALVAGEIAQQYYPELDSGLVSKFSIVHDLVELKTNDIATFTLNAEQLALKEATEFAVLDKLASELPAHTARMLLRYETQLEPEARFVRLIDKVLPVIVDILGPGSKVMIEDYDISTLAALNANEFQLSERLRKRFSEPYFDIIHQARDLLAKIFAYEFSTSLNH